jgi:hypothetical protein
MSDILDEIREDLKYERYAYLWKKYGTYCIVIAIVIVISTATTVWYKQHQLNIAETEGSKLFRATQFRDSAQVDQANALYTEIIQGKSNSTASVAAFNQATTLAKSGKVDEAKALFLTIASQNKYPEEFRQLSELMYIYFTLGQANDKNNSEDIIARLEGLSGKEKIWRYNAKELLAFYLLDRNDKTKAKTSFEELKSDLEAPVSIRKRAEEMLEVMG